MRLYQKDTKMSRIVCAFSDDESWNAEEERWDPEKIKHWNLGKDKSISLEELFRLCNGGLPKEYFERKYRLYHFQAFMPAIRRYFFEEQGILLCCDDSRYFLTQDLEEYLLFADGKIETINNAARTLKSVKFLLLPMKAKTKKLEYMKESLFKNRLPNLERIK